METILSDDRRKELLSARTRAVKVALVDDYIGSEGNVTWLGSDSH